MVAKRGKVKDISQPDGLVAMTDGSGIVMPMKRESSVRGKCPHGRRKSLCKDCGGVGVCVHGRHKYRCKDCAGCSICEHGRIKYDCKECKGSGVCEHGRQKSRCKECGGKGVCAHNKRRSICKDCGGSAICMHNRVKYSCKECQGKQMIATFDSSKVVGYGVMPIIDSTQAPPPPVGVPQMMAMAASISSQMGQLQSQMHGQVQMQMQAQQMQAQQMQAHQMQAQQMQAQQMQAQQMHGQMHGQMHSQLHSQLQAQQLASDMMHPSAMMQSIHAQMQPIPPTSMHSGMPPAPAAPQPRRATHAGPSMQDIAADIHGMPPV